MSPSIEELVNEGYPLAGHQSSDNFCLPWQLRNDGGKKDLASRAFNFRRFLRRVLPVSGHQLTTRRAGQTQADAAKQVERDFACGPSAIRPKGPDALSMNWMKCPSGNYFVRLPPSPGRSSATDAQPYGPGVLAEIGHWQIQTRP